ncbi:MAG: hypothetical protein H7145_03265 [Akkermansiaceae bacterium]|nr:hypothetical protein [Armatimonadota bacterium]
MLYAIDKMEKITNVPYRNNYVKWTSRLSPTEIKAIKDKLNGMITEKDIHTSSWMPGKDWSGTVFMPIYEKACVKNVEVAAMCFGLILWEVMMERPEAWAFGRYKMNEIPIEGMTYFRIELPSK